ncbi:MULTISPECIES: hypothetical protein [unclassified Moorena]|uniref:hypothetical protein n=1 Tax=unclassified Moorena TaxID=2683338 RepID=UPI0013FEEFA6|nr:MULTISPECIES: hypothetical protein [unclassified Moorena]NEO11082.1 hypothetical protein [Moorena sp. SIO3E8]NEQ00870.1 hypothetical protein [Moorena sp. SIO3F7]
MQSLMGETTPVAHGEGLCAELASAPCKPRGNPQDRTGSPRPRCIAGYRRLWDIILSYLL